MRVGQVPRPHTSIPESHHKSDNRPRLAGARALVGLKFRRALALFRETQLAGKVFLRQSQVNESNARAIRAPASQPGIFVEHLSSYYVAAV